MAELALDASGPDAEAPGVGRVAVPNAGWDKPAAPTRDERDRAEMHALVATNSFDDCRTRPGSLMRRAACGGHERSDGPC